MPQPPADSQRPTQSFGDELVQLLKLGLPIAFVQFGMTALNLIDTALLGRHDEASIPVMMLGNVLSFGATVFCMGAVTAIDPLMSQAVGASDHQAIPRLLGRGLLMSLMLSVPTALLLLPSATWLTLLQQPEALIPEAARYAQLQALGVLPFLWYAVLRSLLSAHARLWPQVVTIVVGNAANFALDWLLIFGNWGLPELGATGAATTTVVCRWLMLLGLCAFGWRDIAPQLKRLRDPLIRARAFALAPLGRLLRLGAPIGTQFCLEWGAFGAVGLLVGYFDTIGGSANGNGPNLGGHQVTMLLASLSFMVPLGLGIAASVRVGWAVGRQDNVAVRRSVLVALCTGAGMMSGFMLLFLLLPEQLARLLSTHEEMVAIATVLIPIAGVFQIGDGIQVVAVGCLRGLGDMRSAVLANIVGFWLIGLTVGILLAFPGGFGPRGLWWGLVIGLFVVAVGLLFVLRLRVGQKRSRLSFD
ncbi:MAG: MATE family efflux transporter [Planctomycetota bacterium]